MTRCIYAKDKNKLCVLRLRNVSTTKYLHDFSSNNVKFKICHECMNSFCHTKLNFLKHTQFINKMRLVNPDRSLNSTWSRYIHKALVISITFLQKNPFKRITLATLQKTTKECSSTNKGKYVTTWKRRKSQLSIWKCGMPK